MRLTALPLLSFSLWTAVLPAADWTTFGGNPQRTGWAKDETDLNKDNITKIKLEWKTKVSNESKELNSLTAPLVHAQVIGPKGFKEVVLVAGSSDKVFAIDADTGKMLWERQLAVEPPPKNAREPHWLCPNALNATPVMDRQARTAYVLTSDGKLHALNLVSGADRFPAVPFVPPLAKAWSLNLYENTVYTTTSQGCGGVKPAVYAIDVKDPQHPVKVYQATSGSGGIWGRGGAAIGSDGTIWVETGDGNYEAPAKLPDSVIAVNASTLALKDYYTPSNRAWITKKDLDMGNMSPVVFPFQGRELVAASGKEGVIYLLDAKKPGGEDHRTPLFRSPLYTNEPVHFAGHGFWGAMSTALDSQGTRWLYAPAWGPPHTDAKFPVTYGDAPRGSVMAFKVEEKNGKPVLTPAWRSMDMSVPEPVVITNGMVFALSNGENVTQVNDEGRILTSKERATTPTGNATLYAMDMETGKVLWSSGKTITGFSHFSAPVVSGGRAYVVTWDNTVYAFGLGAAQE